VSDDPYTEAELEAMTKDDLKTIADDMGVEYTSATTKAQLVADILNQQQQEEGGVMTAEQASIGIEPTSMDMGIEGASASIEALAVGGPNPVIDWRAWNNQQGGIQPTTVNPTTQPGGYPPSTSGGTPGTIFPGILPQTEKILGANSTPLYDDTPTYRKPPDLYQGWTAQVPNFMVVQPFPPPSTLVGRISPNHGAASTAVAVTIYGQGFTGATGASVGGSAVTSFAVVNDTTITGTTAATLTAGSYAVGVTNPTKNNTSVPAQYSVP